jgi:hypothetical protein
MPSKDEIPAKDLKRLELAIAARSQELELFTFHARSIS